MNKVITINLNGNAYPLEESGYDALREYLETAARRLEGNPDRDEIIADIEQAIADKFRATLGAYKTVVAANEVGRIIAEMGPVQDPTNPSDDPQAGARGVRAPGGEPGASGGPAAAGGAAGARRLYRIREGALIGGVCTGLAAYFKVNVIFIRILFIATLGLGLAWYIVMMFVVPAADTPAENAAAYGAPFTAEEFIRRAKEGYYQGMRTLHDRRAHREWKRKFKQEMREWKRNWRWHWRQHPPPHALPWIAFPFLGILGAGIACLGLFAVYSLLFKGAVFGVPLPHGVPLWVGLVALIFAVNLLMLPVRAVRHACYYGGVHGWGHANPFLFMWNSVAWLAFMALAVWVADRYVPGAHEVLRNLGHAASQAVDSLNRWLARQ
jgi:phage shock protein PspC (stress-responsive transcriptional regulator)